MLANLKGIFSPAAIAQSLDVLSPMETTIMDSLFKDRPTHPLPDVYNLLREMEKTIKQAGLGGNVEFWAGSDVVSVLLGIVNACVSTSQSSPYNLKLEQGRISVGSFVIRFMDETYPDPADESRWLNKLNPKMLLATATNVKGTVWYCAIDSISANNATIPLHIVPVMRDDDSGITPIGQAKPLPARPSRGTCLCLAVD